MLVFELISGNLRSKRRLTVKYITLHTYFDHSRDQFDANFEIVLKALKSNEEQLYIVEQVFSSILSCFVTHSSFKLKSCPGHAL